MDPRNALFGRGGRTGPSSRQVQGGRGALTGSGLGQGYDRQVSLRLSKIEDKTLQTQYIFSNLCAVSPNDFPPNRDGQDIYIKLTGRMIQGEHVVTARPLPGFPNGCISLSDPQRTWIQVGMTDELVGELYNPFSQGGNA